MSVRTLRIRGLSVVLTLFAFSAYADTPSVCERRDPAVLSELVRARDMRFSFDNEGGLGNGGVCWWHSRFQRAVWAIAEFKPNLPKPSRAQAAKLIDRIAHFEGVVEIPGFAGFFDFSREFQDLIQHELNQWQKRDGFINQAWIRGLGGKARYSPKGALDRMENVYAAFSATRDANEILWLKLQMPGVIAHAALVLDMRRTGDADFELDVVDSNYPDQTKTWRFRAGDTHIQAPEYDEPFMPFDGYARDLTKIRRALDSYCR